MKILLFLNLVSSFSTKRGISRLNFQGLQNGFSVFPLDCEIGKILSRIFFPIFFFLRKEITKTVILVPRFPLELHKINFRKHLTKVYLKNDSTFLISYAGRKYFLLQSILRWKGINKCIQF